MSLMKAIVTAVNHTAAIQRVAVPIPGPHDILIAVKAVASNPTDWKKLDRINEIGLVIGCDFAGVVEEVGSEVPTGLRKKGERVAGYLHGGISKEFGGTFAEYCLADPELVVSLPDTLSFKDAAGLGISGFTACQVLFQKHSEVTPLQPTTSATPILVWGAATALGMYVIQLAKLSGYHVIATASPSNNELLESLGASVVFNYRDPDVSKNIREYTKGKLAFAVDCISELETPKLVTESFGTAGGIVSVILPVDPKKYELRADAQIDHYIVYSLLGKPFSLPFEYPFKPGHHEDGAQYAKLLGELLQSEKLKTIPAKVLPNGLASIPEGLQMTKDGKVKASKLTYIISETP